MLKVYQVDAFTDVIFKGNPAAVCILSGPAHEKWMQDIAMEMNLSETAFLYKQENGFNLRWFTPEEEEDLCGHATLSGAHILWETGVLGRSDEAVFYTRSGRLTAKKDGEYIVLDFPMEEDIQVPTPELISLSLGVPILYTGKNRLDYIVELEGEEVVRNIQPDFEILENLDARGLIITSRSNDPKYDFVSRFFAPGSGIHEDPVTGSAHCCLAPFWEKRLGKKKFTAYQSSKRGGYLKITSGVNRVFIAGKAVTVFCAEFPDISDFIVKP
ncbi:MAG: PhzF family phenazine biosynthesis protein [Clostridiaceae bacterium]